MKQNDYLALNLNLKDSDIDVSNLRLYGITPQNTGLQDKDYYKTIPQVIDTFTKDGKFDDKAFDSFYNSVERSYSNFASDDYLENLINSIPSSSDDIFSLGNTNIYDDSAKIVRSKDPNRHAMGIANIMRTGKPSFSEREVAQANKVRDTEGNVLDWTPNDKGFLKALFRPALALATYEEGETSIENGVVVTHHKGEHKYDPITGDPFYEILGDKEIYGRDVLHFSDTLTREGTFWNKLDIFDSDGIETSIKKTLARTAVEIAAYMAAGPYLGALEAARALSKTIPAVTKAVNSMITNNSDNGLGKTMTSLENWAAQFDRSQSDKGKGKFWSFENIGNQLIDSAKQLYSQGLIRKIPFLLNQHPSIKSQKLGSLAATLYMATTSAEDVYGDYKLAGVSDRYAGIGALATMAAFFGFMNNDYFKQYLFNDPILELPELRKTLKAQARVMGEAYRKRVAENAVGYGVKIETSTAQRLALSEGAKWYNKVYNGVASVINKIPEGSLANNAFLVRGFNEGVEEVMEEGATDLIKGLELGLNELGWDIKDEDASNIDFGYTLEDFLQRYSTSFVGGFMGGMVFEGLNRWDNRKIKSISSLDLDSQLAWYIRNGYKSEIIKTIDAWERANKFGSKELSMKYKIESDGKEKQITWEPGTSTDNQNVGIANALKQRVNLIDAQLKTLGIEMLMSDDDILKGAISENKASTKNKLLTEAEEKIKKEAKKAGKKLDEYKEQNLRDARIDFIKQVGIDKLILSDAADFQHHMMFLSDEIEKRKAELLNVPDTEKAEAQKLVDSDNVIKTYEKELEDTKKALDAIISGERTSEYMALALFAGDDVLKKIYLSEVPSDLNEKRNNTYFEDIKHWVRTKYGQNYDELIKDSGEKDPDTKKSRFESYLEANFTQWYTAKEDISRIRGAYELHKNFSETINPIIAKQISEYSGYKTEDNRSGQVQYDYEASINALKELVEARKQLQNYKKDHVNATYDSDETLKSLEDTYSAALQGYYYVSPQRVLDDKFYTTDSKGDTIKTAIDNLVDLIQDEDPGALFDFVKNYYDTLNSKKIVSEFSDDIFEIGISSAIHQYVNVNISKLDERASNILRDIINRIRTTIANFKSQVDIIPQEDLQEFVDSVQAFEDWIDGIENNSLDWYNEDNQSIIYKLSEFANGWGFDDSVLASGIELDDTRLELLNSNFLETLAEKINNILAEFDKSIDNGVNEYNNFVNWYDSVDNANSIFGDVSDIWIKLLFDGNDIIGKINEIKQIRANSIPTPILDWIDALSIELNGNRLRIWELLKEESQNLRNQDDITKYVINNPSAASELEFLEYALTACEGVLRGAVAGGANTYINALGEEQLPTLENNKELVDVYLHDINIIRQRVATLLDIHQRNHKSTIQLKRDTFIKNAPKFLNNIVGQVTGESTLLQAKFNEILGIDIVQLWNDINESKLDLDGGINEDNFDEFWQKFRTFMNELHKRCGNIDLSDAFIKATNQAGYKIDNVNDLFAYVLTSSYTDLWKYQNSEINASDDSIVTGLDTILVLSSIIGHDPTSSFKAIQYVSERINRKPFWDQMLAILIGHSKKHAPDLFNAVLQHISDKGAGEITDSNFEETARNYLLERPLIKNAISVDGASGTGKTDVVLRFIKLMSEVDTRKNASGEDFTIKSYAVARYQLRANALGNTLGITGDNNMLLSTLFEKYFGEISEDDFHKGNNGHFRQLKPEAIDKYREKLKKDNLKLGQNEILDIYVDESGLLSEGDLQLLSLLSENGKVNLIFAGDSRQTGWTRTVKNSEGQEIPVNSGILDVQILSTPRLTTSLRANNYGMQYNLEQMEIKIDRLFSQLKEKPWIYLSELVDNYQFVPINAERNGLFGITVISNPEAIVESLKNSNSTIGIITDSPDKYNRFTSDTVEVIDPINAQGNEYDYTIIDISSIPNMSDFDRDRYEYTILSRARNGAYIVNSLGDINSSKTRMDAATPVNQRNEKGEIESSDLEEYKNWWNGLFKNDIFDSVVSTTDQSEEVKSEVASSNTSSNPAGNPTGSVPGGLNTSGKEIKVYTRDGFNEDEFKNVIKQEGSNANIPFYTKTSQRVSDLDHYHDYYQTGGENGMHSSDGTLLDLKLFVDWLFNELEYSDPILSNTKYGLLGEGSYTDQEILNIKRFIRDFAYDFIQLDVNSLKDKYSKLEQTLLDKTHNKMFVTSLLNQVKNLTNKPIYAVKSGDYSYFYFIVTGKTDTGVIKHWSIPVDRVKGSNHSGWLNLKPKEIIPLVMLSSAGETQKRLEDVAGEYVEVSKDGYAISVLSDDLDIANTEKGKELRLFVNRNKGNTQKIVTTIFNSINPVNVLQPKLNDGKIERLDQTELDGNTRLSTVNRRLDVQGYFELAKLLKDLHDIHGSHINNDGLNKLYQFFQSTDITIIGTGSNELERLKALRRCSIISSANRNRLTTALLRWFWNNGNKRDGWDSFLKQFYGWATRSLSRVNVNGKIVQRGLSFNFYQENGLPRAYAILYNEDSKDFSVYDALNDNKLEGTISAQDWFGTTNFDPVKAVNSIVAILQNNGININLSDNINDLLVSGDISIGLTTRHETRQSNSTTKVSYYAPFDSDMYDLVPQSTILDSNFEEFLRNDSIFKYGFLIGYVGGSLDGVDNWMEINNPQNAMTDIVEIIPPLFSFEATSLDTSELPSDLGVLGHSIQTSDKSKVTVNIKKDYSNKVVGYEFEQKLEINGSELDLAPNQMIYIDKVDLVDSNIKLTYKDVSGNTYSMNITQDQLNNIINGTNQKVIQESYEAKTESGAYLITNRKNSYVIVDEDGSKHSGLVILDFSDNRMIVADGENNLYEFNITSNKFNELNNNIKSFYKPGYVFLGANELEYVYYNENEKILSVINKDGSVSRQGGVSRIVLNDDVIIISFTDNGPEYIFNYSDSEELFEHLSQYTFTQEKPKTAEDVIKAEIKHKFKASEYSEINTDPNKWLKTHAIACGNLYEFSNGKLVTSDNLELQYKVAISLANILDINAQEVLNGLSDFVYEPSVNMIECSFNNQSYTFIVSKDGNNWKLTQEVSEDDQLDDIINEYIEWFNNLQDGPVKLAITNALKSMSVDNFDAQSSWEFLGENGDNEDVKRFWQYQKVLNEQKMCIVL